MKNKKYLLALLLLLLLTTGYSQVTFVKTYGTNTSLVLSNDMQPTLDGGYIMTGSNDGNSMGGMYLIKTDSSGVLEWSKHYGISGSEGGRSVKQTADSGYIITGFAPDFNDNMWVIKTNSTGNIMWSKTYGGNDSQEGETVISTSDGGYLVTGEDFDQYLKAFMVKTDSNGDTLWTRKGNHPNGFARAYSTIQTLEGDYVVTGYFNNGTSYNNYYLIKLDANGDTLWSKIYDAGLTAQARCVKQLSDFGFIVAGKISGSAQDNIFLLRTDSIGNVTWAKTYGYIGDETAYDINKQLMVDLSYQEKLQVSAVAWRMGML